MYRIIAFVSIASREYQKARLAAILASYGSIAYSSSVIESQCRLLHTVAHILSVMGKLRGGVCGGEIGGISDLIIFSRLCREQLAGRPRQAINLPGAISD